MKKQFTAFLAMALIMFVAGSAFAQKKEVVKTENIKVGIDCPMGKATIEKELAKAPGVKKVEVSMETKVATINYVEGKTSREQLVSSIEKLGYTTEDSKTKATPAKTGCSKSCAKTCGH